MATYDLRNCTLDEFIAYFFDHPVEEEAWHWDDDLSVQYDVTLHVKLFTAVSRWTIFARVPRARLLVDALRDSARFCCRSDLGFCN